MGRRSAHTGEESAPAVSIIVTSYNYGNFLAAALRSVSAQTFGNWECIIVDDGSHDDTADVAARWTSQDERFRYLWQENSGLAAARNAGLNVACGRYIQILDADDLLEPEKLDVQVRLLNSLPDSSLVYSSFCRLYESESGHRREVESEASLIPRGPILDSLLRDWERGLSIPPHCFMFRRSQFETAGAFTPELETHEDLDFYLRLAAEGVAFVHHSDVLAVYRRHANSMCLNRAGMTRGYLRALGLAAGRAPSRRVWVMAVWRYLAEVERCLTDWILRRCELSVIRSVFTNRYGMFTLLGLLLYPVLLVRRFLGRLR